MNEQEKKCKTEFFFLQKVHKMIQSCITLIDAIKYNTTYICSESRQFSKEIKFDYQYT